MLRTTAYFWILAPLAAMWSAKAVAQDVSSGSPVAMSYVADEPTPAAPKTDMPPMATPPGPPAAGAGCGSGRRSGVWL